MLCRVIEALDLSDIYGIGHSAGATDLLLAAKLLPKRFSRLFVMEPTVMDPRAVRADGAGLSDMVDGCRAERAAPPGRVRERRDGVPALSRRTGVCGHGRQSSLRAYIRHGFAPLRRRPGTTALHAGDRVGHHCVRICEAMEQVYTGDDRGNPFAWLTEIDCPVLRCDDGTIMADL